MKPSTFVSYNVNGIRSAMSKDLIGWLTIANPDVIGFQEIKANPEQIDAGAFEDIGYSCYWFPAQKKGYSGVGLLTKIKPDAVIMGMGLEDYDNEGRILRADYGDLTVLVCYFPSGTTGDIRQTVKYSFFEAMYNWIKELSQTRPNLIIMGDYNIAHTEMDIHNPKANQKTSGFLPEERAWMTRWLALPFVDSYRHLNPSQQKYSWWSYRAGSREKNLGWRIDYICITESLAPHLLEADLLNEVTMSDHCPCMAKFSW